MVQSIFTEGEAQSISQVLANKDERVKLHEIIFKQYPNITLLDVKLNIPGPIKNNRYIKKIFESGISTLEKMLHNNNISFTLYKHWDMPAGSENFYLLKTNCQIVKKVAIAFEEQTDLNRLFDADVLVNKQKQAISRSSLGLPVRQCFMCNRPAKDCARSRRHSVIQLQEYISKLYQENFG